MTRRLEWQTLHERFDPHLPADAAQRANRALSPAAEIVEALSLPFGRPCVLLTGTVGTGKSTELMRIAEQRAGDDFVVLIDLHRHFAEVIGDEQALKRVSSWEVLFLVGLAVLRASREVLPYAIPEPQLEALATAWSRLARTTETPDASFDIRVLANSMIVTASAAVATATAATAQMPGPAVAGALSLFKSIADFKWTAPVGRAIKSVPDQDPEVQSLLSAVNTILRYVQSRCRRVLLVIDGLDRIVSLDHAAALFVHSELIAQLAWPVVVCGPFALRSHPAASAIPRFTKVTVLVNEPVLSHEHPHSHGPGVGFFCELYHKRVSGLPADLLGRDLLEHLAYYSGGRARDFVRSIRMLAERAYSANVDQGTPELVERVLDEARRLLETGLDTGHIGVLEAVAADPRHRLPADGRARDLLSYGQLLPYPNESEWYYPHPLLTRYLVRTPPSGSTA